MVPTAKLHSNFTQCHHFFPSKHAKNAILLRIRITQQCGSFENFATTMRLVLKERTTMRILTHLMRGKLRFMKLYFLQLWFSCGWHKPSMLEGGWPSFMLLATLPWIPTIQNCATQEASGCTRATGILCWGSATLCAISPSQEQLWASLTKFNFLWPMPQSQVRD